MADGTRIDLGDFVITFSSEGLPVVKNQAGQFVKTTDRLIAATKLLREESSKLTPQMRRQAQELIKTAAASDKVKNNLSQMARELKKTSSGLASANKEQSKFARLAYTVGASYLTYNLLARSLRLVKDTIAGITAAGIRFNTTMESARLGIASMIASSQNLVGVNGALLTGSEKFAQAQALARSETEKLRIAGLATVATTQQLVEGYQQAVGPLTQAGVALKDVAGVTTKIVQAAGALGMPMFQINEEIRSIAAGTITFHSRVAKTLGITNAMVNQWKASGTFVQELNKRLATFTVAGERAFYTWQGITSNVEEVVDLLAGAVTKETLFEPMKKSALTVVEALLDIKKTIDGEFTGAELSSRFLPQIEKIKAAFKLWGEVIEEALSPKAIEEFLDVIAGGVTVVGVMGKTVLFMAQNLQLSIGVLYTAIKAAKMWGSAMAFATEAIGETAPFLAKANIAAGHFWTTLKGMLPILIAIGVAIAAIELGNLLDDLTDYAGKAREAMNASHDLMAEYKILGKEIEQKQEVVKQFDDAMSAAGDSLHGQREAVLLLKDAFPELHSQYVQGIIDLAEYTKQAKAFIASQKELAAQTRAKALDEAKRSLAEYMNLVRSSISAVNNDSTVGGALEKIWGGSKAEEFISGAIQQINKLLALKGQFPELAQQIDSSIKQIGDTLFILAEQGFAGATEAAQAFTRIFPTINTSTNQTADTAKRLSYGFGEAEDALTSYLNKVIEAAAKKYGYDALKDDEAMLAAVTLRIEQLREAKERSQAQEKELNDLLLMQKAIRDKLAKAADKDAKAAFAAAEKKRKAEQKLFLEMMDIADKTEKALAKGAENRLKYEEFIGKESVELIKDATQKKIAAENEEYQKRLRQYQEFIDKGYIKAEDRARGLEVLEQAHQERLKDINKTAFDKLMDDWADYKSRVGELNAELMKNIQNAFQSTLSGIFKGELDSAEDIFESFADNILDIFAGMIAQMITLWATANIAGMFQGTGYVSFSNFLPSSGGGSVINGISGVGTDLWDWISGSDNSLAGWTSSSPDEAGGLGMSNVPGASGMQWNTLWGGGGFGLGNALGIAGGLYGMWNAYQSGDMFSGALSGAAAGTAILPGWGTAIGAGVGLLSGLLGGGEDDSADREADARRFQELAEIISKGDGDQETYLSAIEAAISSDNRVSGAQMEALYQLAKSQGILEWYTPTPGQLGEASRRNYTDEQWKRYQVYGGTEQGEMGSMAFLELFGGAGKGGWGGMGDQVKDVMEGLDEEVIDRLGSSLGTLKDLATEWGVSIQDLLGPLIDADLADESWEEALKSLSAATLVQNAADAERAAGLDELTIASNAVARSISLMAGWNDMEAQGKEELIKQLQKDASRRDELMRASERLQEVEELLTGAHELSQEEVEALAEEYAMLSEKLGLNDTAAADAADAASEFARVMMEEVVPAIRAALELTGGDNVPSEHTGGWLNAYHTGGWISNALQNGLISLGGGSSIPSAHTGRWLGYRESLYMGLEGERVLSHPEINNMGGPSAVDMMASGALNLSPNQSATNNTQEGSPSIVFAPNITIYGSSDTDKAQIKKMVSTIMADERVKFKRQLDQTTFAVRR